MADRHFTPLVRRGLVRAVAEPDGELSGDLSPASIRFEVDVGGTAVDRTVNLEPATSVTSLQADAIVRRWPAPGALDVETNFFPVVEFADADLPWRYTPAAATTRGRLRPWLALVVVDTGSEVELVVEADGPRLSVPVTELHQLPDPAELWGWAHVQSAVPSEELEKLLLTDPGGAFSRIVCPRILEPDRTYRGAVVAAFDVGTSGGVKPAWAMDQTTPVHLVVYDHWTFSTAEQDGDFESLCELLGPADGIARLGVADVDFGQPGFKVEPPLEVSPVSFPLRDIGSETPEPKGSDRFGDAAAQLLERQADPPLRGYNPLLHDPVLGLPLHGMYQAGVSRLPSSEGWLPSLNRRPDHRLAAGVGASAVRANQEELVAAAWDQAAALREVRDEANRLRLTAEVDRALQRRVAQLEPGPRISAAAQLLSFLTADGEPAKVALRNSGTPSAVAERSWLRNAPATVAADATDVFVKSSDASAPAVFQSVLDVFIPASVGGLVQRPISDDDDGVTWEVDMDVSGWNQQQLDQIDPNILEHLQEGRIRVPKRSVRNTTVSGSALSRRRPPTPEAATAVLHAVASGTTVAGAVSDRSPIVGWRESLVARAPAVQAQIAEGELVSAIVGAPQFEDGVINDLIALDPELLVPGIGDFPPDSVRLLEANGDFIAALLVGANHEMGRELRWRGFPVDRSATFFARFFDHHDGLDDIDAIDDWPPKSELGTNMPGASTISVLLVRGALIERFPDVATFVAPRTTSGDADMDAALPPIFEGLLGVDTAFFGFPVSSSVLRGTKGSNEWFVGFEERFEAARFGLDLTGPDLLDSWLELGRNHFRNLGTHVPANRIPGKGKPTFDNITWGRNSAHLAAATHQPPYRRLYPATTLVGA